MRELNCGSEGILSTALAPAGFGTPFNLVDGTDVIIPVHVTVTFSDGASMVSVDKPGFTKNGQATVHCTYVDPRNLTVDFLGIRV